MNCLQRRTSSMWNPACAHAIRGSGSAAVVLPSAADAAPLERLVPLDMIILTSLQLAARSISSETNHRRKPKARAMSCDHECLHGSMTTPAAAKPFQSSLQHRGDASSRVEACSLILAIQCFIFLCEI